MGDQNIKKDNIAHNDANPYYTASSPVTTFNPDASTHSIRATLKNYLQGNFSSVNQNDSRLGCYDVTLMDGSSGTIVTNVATLPETSVETQLDQAKDSSMIRNVLDTPPPPIPMLSSTPIPPLLPPPPPPPPPLPPVVQRLGNDAQRSKIIAVEDKGLDKTNNLPGTMNTNRPGSRHHLIDIHGLAIFLRQSTRCLSCKGSCCLYVTGAISAQLAAVTKVKITCQKCNYTASQALLKPNEISSAPEDLTNTQLMRSADTPVSTPPSEAASPNQPTPPLESYQAYETYPQSHIKNTVKIPADSIISKNLREKSPKRLKSRLPMTAVPLSLNLLGNEITQEPSHSSSLRDFKDQKPLTANNINSFECHKKGIFTSEYNYLNNAGNEMHNKDFLWTKRDWSSSPDSSLPDISIHEGLSTQSPSGSRSQSPRKVESLPSSKKNSDCNSTKRTNDHPLLQASPSTVFNTNSHVSKEEFQLNIKKEQESESKDIDTSYFEELLQSKLRSTTHSSRNTTHSPMSLESSLSSDSCSHPSSSSTSTAPYQAMSLLKLLLLPGIPSALPMNSQILPTNHYSYQQGTSLETLIPSKEKISNDAIQLAKKRICDTKTPPQSEMPTKKSKIENDTTKTGDYNKKYDLQCESNNFMGSDIYFHRFLKNYLQFIQSKDNPGTPENSCSPKQHKSKDKSKSAKRSRPEEQFQGDKSKNVFDWRAHERNRRESSSENNSNKEESFKDERANSNIPLADTPTPQDKSKSGSQSHPQDGKSCRDTEPTENDQHDQNLKKSWQLEKQSLRTRRRIKSKNINKRMRASSVSCHCCYNAIYHKRMMKIYASKLKDATVKEKNCERKLTKKTSHNEGRKGSVSQKGEDDNTLRKSSYKTVAPDNKNNREEYDFAQEKSSETIYPGENDNTVQKGELHKEETKIFENESLFRWIQNETPLTKEMVQKYIKSNAQFRKNWDNRNEEESAKYGRFHELLSSESDSSDSEEGKLTIDFDNK